MTLPKVVSPGAPVIGHNISMPIQYLRSALGACLMMAGLSSVAFPAVKDGALQDIYVTANGIRLHCITQGRGELVVFLHGFPEFSYEWKDQLREFGRDHRVVAPDLRGYNLSDKPPSVDDYRVPVLLEDIRSLADHLRKGRKFILVGHDWGGALAWSFAAAHPEYLDKLVIINAPYPAVFGKLLASDPVQQKASQYMFMFRSPQAEEKLAANNYALLSKIVLGDLLKTGAMSEEDQKAYVQAWSQPGALTGGLNYYRASRLGPPAPPEVEAQIGPSDSEFGRETSQAVIRVPTLVIWGEKDPALPLENLDGLQPYVPQLTIKRIPEGSHWVIHEKPAEVNGYIRAFITSP
jgi:pimeloyl-ACP methyl ester carboxylesterase